MLEFFLQSFDQDFSVSNVPTLLSKLGFIALYGAVQLPLVFHFELYFMQNHRY